MSKSIGYELQPGKILGRNYRVLEFLGNGWEGEVYKVEERSTGIVRAAKLYYKKHHHRYSPHITYAQKLYCLRDCPIVMKYHHQDVTTIKKQSVEFLVSEFLEGHVLSQYVKNQPGQRLNPFVALHLFYALVLGVEKIHFLGEYHGDIHAENIIVKQKGLHFEVYLIDFLHLGKSTKAKIQHDVYDLIKVLYEMIGGDRHYKKMSNNIRKIILGRKHSLISKQFKMAGHLRIFMENLTWDDQW